MPIALVLRPEALVSRPAGWRSTAGIGPSPARDETREPTVQKVRRAVRVSSCRLLRLLLTSAFVRLSQGRPPAAA
jgi:hypothetical protein